MEQGNTAGGRVVRVGGFIRTAVYWLRDLPFVLSPRRDSIDPLGAAMQGFLKILAVYLRVFLPMAVGWSIYHFAAFCMDAFFGWEMAEYLRIGLIGLPFTILSMACIGPLLCFFQICELYPWGALMLPPLAWYFLAVILGVPRQVVPFVLIFSLQILHCHLATGYFDELSSWAVPGYLIAMALLFGWLYARWRYRVEDRHYFKDDPDDSGSWLFSTPWRKKSQTPLPPLLPRQGRVVLLAADLDTGQIDLRRSLIPTGNGFRVFPNLEAASACALNLLAEDPNVEWVAFDDQGWEVDSFRVGRIVASAGDKWYRRRIDKLCAAKGPHSLPAS